ncbi:MAG: hypothetical protein KAJ07_12010 [Planctomycetes bacterium]|nr:hypothetical protein [Planctomycetota bacterium]
MVVFVVLVISTCAHGMVFINEVFINPIGASSESDIYEEFIELLGTPGMKLDGYAVVVFNGKETKYYPIGTIPTGPPSGPEIEQFFSLDGLSLGANGLLVLTVTDPTWGFHEEMLIDSSRVAWNTLWNGGPTANDIDNNGSLTFMIVRNRPGITEADPTNSAGLLWAKEIKHDQLLVTSVWDDNNSIWVDQWGDGNIDKGESDGMGGNSLDLTGLTTVGDVSDDLEIVDEVSYEDDAGWEYDTDGRHVDFESTHSGFPHRHVHSLDNPIAFNPDAITRVDYRTTGDGWTPSGGGTGEMSNGNNWQDTATEQWIRGNSENGYVPAEGNRFAHFYDNDSEPLNPVQPRNTNVPVWLDDGDGNDYNFLAAKTYEIAAGRINSLAVPFIPGDVNRDGECDAEDITKIVAVFGDDDWIFSNSFWDSPEGDEVDPATQTKPWDIDGTGDNGIEASDMQWVLNFQGDTTGQIVGIQYDSTTPVATGVYLNSNGGVTCGIDTSVNVPSGRTNTTLLTGDIVEITVSGEVTAGANSTAGEENGIMQYIHDFVISSGGVIKVLSVEALGSYNTTRPSLQQLIGNDGDLGIDLINGYTTSFSEGLSGLCDMYKVTLGVVGAGSANVTIWPAADAKFVASTAEGVKIGHTDNNGNPASSSYPGLISFQSTANPADFNGDNCIDSADFVRIFAAWLSVNGEGNWDAVCDISLPSDVIDQADLARLFEDWMAGCGM